MIPLSPAASVVDLPTLVAYGLINVVAAGVYAIGLYYRRYRRRDLAVVFAFFTVCLFVIVRTIQMTEMAAALGFGLFAILSIIRLRSEPFSNVEIGYFFGALVLGLINGIGPGTIWLTLAANLVVVGAMALIDHPGVLTVLGQQRVVLDSVHSDPDELRSVLEARLRVEVVAISIESTDFIRDAMHLEVRYRCGPHRRVGAGRARWARRSFAESEPAR